MAHTGPVCLLTVGPLLAPPLTSNRACLGGRYEEIQRGASNGDAATPFTWGHMETTLGPKKRGAKCHMTLFTIMVNWVMVYQIKCHVFPPETTCYFLKVEQTGYQCFSMLFVFSSGNRDPEMGQVCNFM